MVKNSENWRYFIKRIRITRGETKTSEKRVKVDFTNPEGRMKLSVQNKTGDSVDTAIKIMKAFDEACKEIREDEGSEEK